MDENVPWSIVGLLIILSYWVWPVVVFSQTGSWLRSAFAMRIESFSSCLLLVVFVIVHWLKSWLSQRTK
jgi:hypothetical protein